MPIILCFCIGGTIIAGLTGLGLGLGSDGTELGSTNEPESLNLSSGAAGLAGGTYYTVCGCCLSFCLSIGFSAWYITDLILFAINDIPDGDGLILRPW
eukprot:UN00267